MAKPKTLITLQAYAEKKEKKFLVTLKIIKDLHDITEKSFLLPKEKSSFVALTDELYPLGKPHQHPTYVTKKEFKEGFVNYTLNQNPSSIPVAALIKHYDDLFKLSTGEALGYVDNLDGIQDLTGTQKDKLEELLTSVKQKNADLLKQYKENQSQSLKEDEPDEENKKWETESQLDPNLPPPTVEDPGNWVQTEGNAALDAPPDMPLRKDTSNINAQANFNSNIMGDSVPPKPKMSGKRPVVDLTGLSQQQADIMQNMPKQIAINFHGIGGDRRIEPVPAVMRYPGDAVLQGANNTVIQCDRDELYRLKGHTGAGAIYLCAGRDGRKTEDKENAKVDPLSNTALKKPNNLVKDAAYVYVSQKSDPATLLKVAGGTYSKKVSHDAAEKAPRAGLSLVAIKADDVVIMSRESGIRLITGADQTNSKGEPIWAKFGIDLIAGNIDDERYLQPLVLGDNLETYLKNLSGVVDKLRATLYNFITSQLEMNAATAQHSHYDPFSIFLGTMATGNPTQLNGGKNYLSQDVFDAGQKAILANAQQQKDVISLMQARNNNDINAFTKTGGYRIKSPKNRVN